jgi:hypothetical protein
MTTVATMHRKLTFLLSSAIALGCACLADVPAIAQSTSAPATENITSDVNPNINLKINSQQKKAIEALGDFVFDQMDTIISTGFDPSKLNQREMETQATDLSRLFSSSFRLDEQQKGAFRSLLRTARDQMKRQINP